MRPYDLLNIKCEKMAFGGRGLARHEGRVVFVPDVIPGEMVAARVRKLRRDFAECDLVEIVEPSADRVVPDCPLVAECGGCQWMHISYPAQLSLKTEVLRDTIRRVGGIADPEVLPTVTSEEQTGYRHRGQFKVGVVDGSPAVGFYRESSHDLVDIARCPVFHPRLNDVLAALRGVIAAKPRWVEAIAEGRICASSPAGETFLLLMPRERRQIDAERLFDDLRREVPHLIGLAVSKEGPVVSRAGDNTLHFELPLPTAPSLHLAVSDGGFFQANWPTSRRLVETALVFLDPAPKDTVLDLYAGVGNFSLAFASRAGRVVGVEEDQSASRGAVVNANLNGITNFEIIAASSEAGIRQVQKADLVHLDPPRQGAATEVLEGVAALMPRRIVYTSCNPSTLARDLKLLSGRGYRVGRIQPVDMFPQTYHIETVVELTRLQGRGIASPLQEMEK